MSADQNPILVTGIHRSGTTWVGKMLSASDRVAYISEPLNVSYRPGMFNVQIKNWYTYICEQNESQYLSVFQDMLHFQYNTRIQIKSLHSIKDVLRMMRDWSNFTHARIKHLRPLIKDPFAVFSIPWFVQKLDCRVIVTIRHPAAVASSLKRLNWSFDFDDLLNQPLLMHDLLYPYKQEMEAFKNQPNDIIGISGLLWRMIYATVENYKNKHPQLQIVRHEDLSNTPEEGYRQLYQYLELDFSPHIKKTITSSSSPNNPAELSTKSVHSTRLDSRANLNNWKHRLTKDEIARLHEITADVAGRYYSEQEWV